MAYKSRTKVAELKLIDIDLSKEIEKILMEIGEKCMNECRQRSPRKSGIYADGWEFEKDGDSVIVYNNSDHRSLSHLIEKGHPTRWGKFAKAQPHVLPSYLISRNEMEKKMAEMLKDKIDNLK